MSDIGYWLTKKYAIQQQQADAASRLSGAQASHVNAETGEVAANAAAQRAAQLGQAEQGYGAGAASRANAVLNTAHAATVPGLANAEIGQRQAQAGLFGNEGTEAIARAGLFGSQARNTDVTTMLAPRIANADVDAKAQQGNLYNAQASEQRAHTGFIDDLGQGNIGTSVLGGLSRGNYNPNVGVYPSWAGGRAAGDSNVGAHPVEHQHALHAYFASLGYQPEAVRQAHTAVPAHAAGTSNTAPGAFPQMNYGTAAAPPGAAPLAPHNMIPEGLPNYPVMPDMPGYAAGTSSVGGQIPGIAPGVSGQAGHPLDVSQAAPPRPVAQDPAAFATTQGFQPVAAPQSFQPAPAATQGFAAGTDDVSGYQAAGAGMPAPQNYKTGSAKVAGQGDGKTDKTLSMLAPGEAVLNKAAAEHLGRDTIDLLNAAGAQKMGLSQQPNQPASVPVSQAKVPGNKGGNSNVQPGKAAAAGSGDKAPDKAKAKDDKGQPPAAAKADKKGSSVGGDKPAPKKGGGGISPQMIAALAGMMGQGGGMPAPGGPGPMAAPQPMPAAPPQPMPPQVQAPR